MVVQCQIQIQKAKEGVFRPGEAITGRIRYFVDKPTEFKNVTLSLLGKGTCVWRQGTSKNRRTYRGKEDYVITHLNICNKRPQDTVTLKGKYECPFEFFLPEDIPRSYKDSIGSISYCLELKFEKTSFFSFNKISTVEVPVYSYLNPKSVKPITFGLEKKLFAPFASETPVVALKAKIDKSFVTPGENIKIEYEVTNKTDLKITSVQTELYCYKIYTANCGKKRTATEKVARCEARSWTIAERTTSNFISILPTLPELYSITNSKVISVGYRVVVTVRLPFPHMDARVEMPVLLGEVRRERGPTLEAEDGEDPPTYWEAMNDKKNGDKNETDSD